jgi:spermidine synthase
MTTEIGPQKSDIRIGLLILLAFLSGGCALAYEILYMRSLSAVLGDMFYVSAALLSTFLVGIALGSRFASRRFPFLPLLEIATGLYALILPCILRWLSGQSSMALISASPILTIAATIILIAPPGLLIGFSIPLFSAYIKYFRVGSLSFRGIYNAYNLGAVLSLLAVELILVRHCGIRLSLAIVGGINIGNGIFLLLMKAVPPAIPHGLPRMFPDRAVIALAVASFSSAIFQMFFLKLIYHFFYPQAENFAIGLSIILLGVFLGSWLASKGRISFESYLIAGAFILGLIYVAYDPLIRFFTGLLPWSRLSIFTNVALKLFFGAVFALGPMIIFGALIPSLMDTEVEVAGESGYLLFISGLANAAGYLAYVFIGHPLLPAGALLASLGMALLLVSLVMSRFKWSHFQLALASMSMGLLILLPCLWRESHFYLARMLPDRRDYVAISKSTSDSATLVQTYWDAQWISYNGHPSIFVTKYGRINQAEMVSGVIPALYAPSHKKALVIGMGTGITIGSLSSIFESTDVVDLNRAFFKMLPRVSGANFDVMHNKTVTFHCADGRSFLIGKEGVYDAILNTAEAPDYFSAQKLYTTEFYERVARALKPDGIFCTWLSYDEMSEPGVLLILSALHRHFKYCDLRVLENSYCQLTCSNRRLVARKFSDLPLRGSLGKELRNSIPDFDLDEYFEDILISANLFDHFVPEVPRENTDDYPALEFSAARGIQLNAMGENLFCRGEKQALLNIDIVRKDTTQDPARLARRARTFEKIGMSYFNVSFRPLLMKDRDLSTYFLLWQIDRLLARNRRSAEAKKILDIVLRFNPDSAEAHNTLGILNQALGRNDEAVKNYHRALQLKPEFEEARHNLDSLLHPRKKSRQSPRKSTGTILSLQGPDLHCRGSASF